MSFHTLELIRAKQTTRIPRIFASDNKNTKWDTCELIDCLSPPHVQTPNSFLKYQRQQSQTMPVLASLIYSVRSLRAN